jgi:hypothetical protein
MDGAASAALVRFTGKGVLMDEKDKRRLAHLKRLEKNHGKEFPERFATEKSRAKVKAEAITDHVSADWNKKQKANQGGPEFGKPLPDGWRDAHWKTLQAMAAEFPGVETSNKEESLSALEAYEADLAG